MLQFSPAPEEERRVIPLRAATLPPRAPMGSAVSRRLSGARGDAGRRYLKAMLPAIPVVACIVGYLYSSLMVGVSSGAPLPQSTSSSGTVLPLVGGLLLGLTTGVLCVCIYWGYTRASACDRRASLDD